MTNPQIYRTPSGRMCAILGQTPTHPESREWVAIEFPEGGQSTEAFDRLTPCEPNR